MLLTMFLVLCEANMSGPIEVEFVSMRLSMLRCQRGPLHLFLSELQLLGSRRVLQRMATASESVWPVYI